MTQHKQGASVSISSMDQKEIQELYEKLRGADAKLVSPDGKAEVLPNNVYSFLCRLLRMDRVGHFPMFEDPERFFAALEEYLTSVLAQPSA